MAGWRKWFGRGGDDAAPPRLDPPDVTARRVEAKRVADLAEWSRLQIQTPDIADRKVTRADVDRALKAAGYRRVMSFGEAVWRMD